MSNHLSLKTALITVAASAFVIQTFLQPFNMSPIFSGGYATCATTSTISAGIAAKLSLIKTDNIYTTFLKKIISIPSAIILSHVIFCIAGMCLDSSFLAEPPPSLHHRASTPSDIGVSVYLGLAIMGLYGLLQLFSATVGFLSAQYIVDNSNMGEIQNSLRDSRRPTNS